MLLDTKSCMCLWILFFECVYRVGHKITRLVLVVYVMLLTIRFFVAYSVVSAFPPRGGFIFVYLLFSVGMTLRWLLSCLAIWKCDRET